MSLLHEVGLAVDFPFTRQHTGACAYTWERFYLVASSIIVCSPRQGRHRLRTRRASAMSVEGRERSASESASSLCQCQCCDYFTLSERGCWELCKVCFWEDEELDFDAPDFVSGANHITLREGRENFSRLGACEKRVARFVCSPAERSRYDHEPRAWTSQASQ